MKRPMIFYSYDLDEFEKSGRGFYGNYKSIVPGPIAYDTDDIIKLINEKIVEKYNINDFLLNYLENCDGNSRQRLYNLLME